VKYLLFLIDFDLIIFTNKLKTKINKKHGLICFVSVQNDKNDTAMEGAAINKEYDSRWNEDTKESSWVM